MRLVFIEDVYINPKKVIMVEKVPVNLGGLNGKTWTKITLEGSYPREHPATLAVMYEPNTVHTYLPLDEVVAIINGGLNDS